MQTMIKTADNNGFTALELIIVLIMIGILAAVAIPAMNRIIERTRGERTIANIELIKDAWQVYIIKHRDFSGSNPASLRKINNLFGLELTDPWFDYNPVAISSTNLSITAVRTASGESVEYNYYRTNAAETWGGNWPWLP